MPLKVRPTPLERLLAACPDDLPDDPSERRQSVITMGRAAQAFAKQPGVDEWAVPYARAIEGAARGLVQGGGVDDGPAFSALEEAVGGLQTAINQRREEVAVLPDPLAAAWALGALLASGRLDAALLA